MANSGIIFVTGATGKQGGAVAGKLADLGFTVKALCRQPDSVNAQNLRKQNMEIVQGDLNDISSFEGHLKKAYGVFSVQTFEHGIEKEIKQGTALATLAKKFDVRHFLYSSVALADANTGIPHFESKFQIENHIKNIGLPYTILRPASFYENFLLPQVRSRILKGKLVSPLNRNTVQPYIAVEDIGKIGAEIFHSPEKYIGRTITVATAQMEMQAVASVFSEVLGKEMKYEKLPSIIAWLAMSKDLRKMFKWVNENHFHLDEAVDSTRKEFADLLTLRGWIGINFKTQ